MKEDSPKQPFGKAFAFSFSVGGVFGFLAGFVFHGLGVFALSPYILLPLTALIAGSISGSAGVLGMHINKVLDQKGWEEGRRRAISYVIIAVLTLTLGIGTLILFGKDVLDTTIFRRILFIIILGPVMGAVISLIDYRVWRVRRRMIELEMENRFLGDLAHRDHLLQEAIKNILVAEERNRMARDLHDSISQGVHAIVYGLHTLQSYVPQDSQKGREIFDHLQATSQATLVELRELIGQLKPSALEDKGLTEALSLQADIVARCYGFTLQTHLNYQGGLSSEQEIAIYRIVQEALANAARHAGADEVQLHLYKRGNSTIVRIADDGRGFQRSKVQAGMGLNNMEMRARQANGHFSLNSQEGRGTIVEVQFD